jgi:hypothetical protein
MKVIRLCRPSEHHVSFHFLSVKDIDGLGFMAKKDQIHLHIDHKKRGILHYQTYQGSIDDVQLLESRWKLFQTNEAIFFDLAWFEPLTI